MKELLMKGLLERSPEIPSDTGPGPTELIGCVNEDLGPGTNKGFYGEVPVDELIDGAELASMIGLTVGTAHNTNDPWLKFIIDGKIYFVAKRTYRYNLTWNHIQAANAVYGDRILQIGEYRYRIGLLKGADTDPATYTGGGYNQPGTLQSEWNRLLYNVAKDLPAYPKAGQIGDNWAEYEQSNVAGGLGVTGGYGYSNWCQENSDRVCVIRGHNSVTYSVLAISYFNNASVGWRPRLELIVE